MFQLLCLPTKICFKLTSRLKPACLSRVFTANILIMLSIFTNPIKYDVANVTSYHIYKDFK